MSQNEKHTIEFTVRTPIAIGGGDNAEWINGIDYVVKDGKVYHLNMKKMFHCGVNPDTLAQRLLNPNETTLITLLGSRLPQAADYVYTSPLKGNFSKIKPFIREGLTQLPYIPGSSLKGAIRSVLFKELYRASKLQDESQMYGKANDGSDWMRFFHIGDTVFNNTQLVNTKIFNLQKGDDGWEGGWKHDKRYTDEHFKQTGFNTLYECLPIGAKAVGNITIAENAMQLFHNEKNIEPLYKEKQNLLYQDDYTPIENLFDLINNHSYDYIEKEINFYDRYGDADRVEDIVEFYEKLKKELSAYIKNGSKSCLIKMAAGSGFHSITGDWQYTDYVKTGNDPKTGKVKYKSRKIAIVGQSLMPMGFLKLTLK